MGITWQLFWFMTLMLFASSPDFTWRMSAYAVATECYFLISMFFISSMRTVAIVASQYQEISTVDLFFGFKSYLLKVMPIVILLGALFVIFSNKIGVNLYHLENSTLHWWQVFVICFVVAFPLCFINSIYRGIWQSKRRFKALFYLDLFIFFGIFLSLMVFGITINNPYLVWGGFFVTEFVAFLYFYVGRKVSVENLRSNSSLNRLKT